MGFELKTDAKPARTQEVGRLFQRAARVYSDLILKKMAEKGYEGLTLFHTALIANLDPEGTRITVLAKRAGMAKQSMGQLANDLEGREYVERVPDPDDRRAYLIRFTKKGEALLHDSYEVKGEVEAEYAAELGREEMEMLRSLLGKLVALYE